MRVRTLNRVWHVIGLLDDESREEATEVMARLTTRDEPALPESIDTEVYVAGKWLPAYQVLLTTANVILTYFVWNDDEGAYVEMWYPVASRWGYADE